MIGVPPEQTVDSLMLEAPEPGFTCDTERPERVYIVKVEVLQPALRCG